MRMCRISCVHVSTRCVVTIMKTLPVCVRVWILRFSERANILPQLGNAHENGFSPVCTRMWLMSLYLALNAFPPRIHSSHMQTWLRVSSPAATCSVVTWSTSSCMELKVWSQTDVAVRPSLCLGEVRSIHLQTSSVLTVGPLEKSNRPSISPVPLLAEAQMLVAFGWGGETMLEAPELLFPSGETRPLCLATTAARFMLSAAGWPALVAEYNPLFPAKWLQWTRRNVRRCSASFLCVLMKGRAHAAVSLPPAAPCYIPRARASMLLFTVNGGEQTRRNTAGRDPTLSTSILVSFPCPHLSSHFSYFSKFYSAPRVTAFSFRDFTCCSTQRIRKYEGWIWNDLFF